MYGRDTAISKVKTEQVDISRGQLGEIMRIMSAEITDGCTRRSWVDGLGVPRKATCQPVPDSRYGQAQPTRDATGAEPLLVECNRLRHGRPAVHIRANRPMRQGVPGVTTYVPGDRSLMSRDIGHTPSGR
jgi:hypothetical protein